MPAASSAIKSPDEPQVSSCGSYVLPAGATLTEAPVARSCFQSTTRILTIGRSPAISPIKVGLGCIEACSGRAGGVGELRKTGTDAPVGPFGRSGLVFTSPVEGPEGGHGVATGLLRLA